MHMLGLCKENECLLGNLAWHLGRTCFRDTPSPTLHIPRYIGDFTCPRLGNIKSYTQKKKILTLIMDPYSKEFSKKYLIAVFFTSY